MENHVTVPVSLYCIADFYFLDHRHFARSLNSNYLRHPHQDELKGVPITTTFFNDTYFKWMVYAAFPVTKNKA